jgi:hypothetical protein
MDTKSQRWLKEYGLPFFLLAATLLTVYLAVRVNLRFWSIDTVGYDTYYSWVEGRHILRGQNPYERILHGSMEENNKYATYFPLFYEASALVQERGFRQYHEWIGFWRYIFLACNVAVGLLLGVLLYSPRTWIVSLLGMAFWYFNRWTLSTSESAALDFIPILLMVLSLAVFPYYRRASLLLYSFSLAIKQIAIFLLPLYLIWEYRQTHSIRKTVLAGLWIASIPLLASLPFLAWNAEGFLKSIAFSGTRAALNHFGAASIDAVLNLEGLIARVPFLILLCAAYLAAWQKTMGRYGSAMIVMAIFIAFNSVLFEHYPVWLMALLPLAAGEWIDSPAELQKPNSPGKV